MKFRELNLDEAIIKAIDEIGYDELTPIQEESINYIIEGKDVLAEAPTGTGKTCAFSLPLINNIDPKLKKVQGLIICPTRELAIQCVKEIRNYYKYKEGCSSLPIYGGQQISRQIMLLKKCPNIIVGTPGRILDHLGRRTIRLDQLKYLVLDECDEMLNMGFKPDIDKILESIKSEHQTLLFSATISEEIKSLSSKYQNEDKIFIQTKREKQFNEYIKQYFINVNENEKKKTLTNILNISIFNQGFIFVRTKKKVEHLHNILKYMGYNVISIHGGMSQRQRDDSMKSFREGKTQLMVATDLAARGLDIGKVDLVINYDLPDELEYYLHRIGRTGRANGFGKAITFLTKKEMVLKSKFEAMTKDKLEKFELLSKKEEEKIMAKKVLNEIENELVNGNLDDYENIVKEYLHELSSQGENISSVKLAALLLKKYSKKPSVETIIAQEKSKETKEKESKAKKESNGSESKTIRFFINCGTLDDIQEGGLRKLIKTLCKIDDHSFEDVYCKNSYSFVEIKREDKDAFLKGMLGHILPNGRVINIEESEKKPTKSERKKRGEEKDRKRLEESKKKKSSKGKKDSKKKPTSKKRR